MARLRCHLAGRGYRALYSGRWARRCSGRDCAAALRPPAAGERRRGSGRAGPTVKAQACHLRSAISPRPTTDTLGDVCPDFFNVLSIYFLGWFGIRPSLSLSGGWETTGVWESRDHNPGQSHSLGGYKKAATFPKVEIKYRLADR